MISVAPGNLRSTITGATVRLDWDPVLEAVSSFLIEAGSAPTLANLAQLNTGSPTPVLIVNNVPNGIYYVRVRAVGPDGIPGPSSNEIVVRVGGGGAPPSAPTGLAAQVTGNQVNLSWTAPGGGNPAGSYVVEAGSATTLSNIVVFDTANAATQLSAVAPNGRYYVRIRGSNSGGVGPPSNEIVIDVPGGGGGGCSYTVSPSSLTLTHTTGSFSATVSATRPDCAWSASGAGFVSVESGGQASGNGSARFAVRENSSSSSRSIRVRVAWLDGSHEIDVFQSAQPPPPPTPTPPVDSIVTVPPQPEVTPDPEPTPPPVPCSVTRPDARCIVIASAAAVQNSNGTLTLPLTSADGQQFDGAIVTNAASFSGGTPQASTHLVLTFATPRTTASVTLAPLTTQALSLQVGLTSNSRPPFNYTSVSFTPLPCVYTLTGPTSPLPSAAGSFEVTISPSRPDCTWTTTSVPSFVSVTTGSGSGTGTARFSIAANTGTTARSGTVTIAGQSITITQQGQTPPAPCFYSTTTSLSFSGSATTFTVPITVTAQPPLTPTTCASWSASSLSSFMTVVNPGPFSGSTQTSVNLAANNTGGTRTGTIRISFGESSFNITVTQATAVNSTPRLTSTPCTNPPTGPGGTISCPGSAVDDNAGDIITWAPTTGHTCTWFTVQPYTPANPVSVTMRGTVPAGFSGTCNINFAVCDQRGGCTNWTGFHTWIPTLVERVRDSAPNNAGKR